MQIILEGPRAVGKSTLAKALARHYKDRGAPVDIIDHSPEPRTTLVTRLVNYIGTSMERIVIQDRYHISEWVYGVALNRRPESALRTEMLFVNEALKTAHEPQLCFILMAPAPVLHIRRQEVGKPIDIPVVAALQLYRRASTLFDATIVEAISQERAMQTIIKITNDALIGTRVPLDN